MRYLRLAIAFLIVVLLALLPMNDAGAMPMSEFTASNPGMVNIDGECATFSYQYSEVTKTIPVNGVIASGAVATMNVSNLQDNKIGNQPPIVDTYKVAFRMYNGDSMVEDMTYDRQELETQNVTLQSGYTGYITHIVLLGGGIDNGFWAGFYGPTMCSPTLTYNLVTPVQSPEPSPSATPSPSPSPEPTATPGPVPSESSTPTSSPEPSPSPTTIPEATPTPSPTSPPPIETPSPSPSPQVNVVNGNANEGEGLTLSAPIGKIFTSVVFASYGTPNGYSIGECHEPSSAEKVAEVFLGKAIATIMAVNDLFGDPCGGTYKFLAVSLGFGDSPTAVEPQPSPQPTPTETATSPQPSPTPSEPSPSPTSESTSATIPSPEPSLSPSPQPQPSQEPSPSTPEPTPLPSPTPPAVVPEPIAIPDPPPAIEPEPIPSPDVEPTPDETPIPEPEPEPLPSEPEQPPAPEPEPEPQPEPVETPEPAPEPEPEPAEPPPPIEEPSPEPLETSEVIDDALADGKITPADAEAVVDSLMEDGEVTEAEATELIETLSDGGALTGAEEDLILDALAADGEVTQAEVNNLSETFSGDGKFTEAEKELVAEAIIAQFDGAPVTAAAIAEAGIDYENLPPETPVETRVDESGEPIVITAEVADALELVANPSELAGAIFTDPAKALMAIGNIGADMSNTERQESQTVVVASVIVGAIASLSIRRM